jgi:hypothetical protein
LPELLAWIAKSRLKQGKYPLEIARFGNLAEPKGNFSGFSDSLLGGIESANHELVQFKVRVSFHARIFIYCL